MFGRSTSSFDRALDKATSQLLLEPDWDSILQICDNIRQADVQPKYAVSSIKKKVTAENPHVCMFALQVLESSVKNCGSVIQQEVATKEFMEFLKDLVKVRSDPVKSKILEMIQCWSHAFRNEPSYKVVQDTYQIMKMEGYTFPELKEADAMFVAEKAPEWKDGDCCHRCRVQFTLTQRKHHCRNCGEIFCGKCSSKNSIIPKFGIEKEVRVCESCYETLNKGVPGSKKGEDDLPAEYLASTLAQQSQAPPTKSEQDLQEEEELQLALALSQSEAEEKEKERERLRNKYSLYGSGTSGDQTPATTAQTEPVQHVVMNPVIDTSDMEPELARYLNRNYWRQKHEEAKVSTTTPSAPVAASEPKVAMTTVGTAPTTVVGVQEKYQNGETDDQDQFLNALKGSIDIFINRMRSNSMRGRSIANDSSVQTLFMTINAMHPQLMKYVGDLEDTRTHYESLQDKLAQLRDAREALDALREDHAEKRRREEEERERQRQIQMARKLEIMRQKKHEYLEYQRQLALQRMQEQEREMQMRLEQQKQMQQMRAMQYAYPQVPMYGQPGQNFSPAGSVEGSPLHHPQPAGSYPQQPGMGAPAPPMGVQPQPGTGQPPPTTQAMYSQGNFQGQPGQPPAGYPSFQPPNTTYQAPQGGYQAPPPAASQAPPAQHIPPGPPPQGYPAQPPSSDYQSFNMQGVATALPTQGQPSQPPPPQPSGQPAPPQQQPYLPPPQYPPGVVPPQQGPPQHPPPHQKEAELISFD